jgi:phosphoribosyl 1,2-cyclic phosphodiesterase
MGFPFFPLQLEALKAKIEFHDLRAGDTINPWPGVTVRTAPLVHPGGATGYRVEYGNRSVAYLTDTEIGDGPINPAMLGLARDADLLILDTTFTDAQLPSHVGWGHASWQQGVRLADEAGAARLCLFHHNPEHDDAAMDAIEMAADDARPGTIAASEGLQLDI